jgi:outer membrane immunogenic protein
MRRILCAALAVAALVGPSFAADLARPYYRAPSLAAAFGWTGCYIGGDVGGAWSDQDVLNNSPYNQGGVTGTISASRATGGGYVGCNYQWTPAWVIGIEGDWSGVHLGGNAVAPNLSSSGTPVGSGGIAWTSNLESIATLRGRIGYAWAPNVLLFVTGGGAWGKSSYTSIDSFTGGCPNCGFTSFSNTSSGWVAGAGVDWAPWSNDWTVRVEYLHYDLQGATSTSLFPDNSGVAAYPAWNNVSVNSVRAGLSHRFW